MANQDRFGRRQLLAIPLTAALLLIAIVGAEAHAAYLRSIPGQGAVVATAPERVEIWFTQDLFRRQGENWILVYGPNGEEVQEGDAQIDDDDRRHMWVDLQSPLLEGQYRVEWRSLSSEDGDDEEGEITFTLDPHVQVTSTPMQAHTETPPPSPTQVTELVVTPTLAPTREPESEPDSSCSIGLAPVITLAMIGLGLKKWRP